jgi:peptidoglycan hydrolase-like protein with peptidoglycan-binding domain
MSDSIGQRIAKLVGDNNLDLEDVLFAWQVAQADGRLTTDEIAALQAAVTPLDALLEPAARKLVADLVAGRAELVPPRILLAAIPHGGQADLYQPREEVIALQDALTTLGYPATADGLYGSGTAGRVGEFQAAAGLSRTGQVDSSTLLALNERLLAAGLPVLDLAPRARIRPDQVVALRRGTNTSDNRAIQAALTRLGAQLGVDALRLEADGIFGSGTEAAVKLFQARVYLPETGIVDRTTLGALDAALVAHGLATTGVTGPAAGAGLGGAVELHFYPGDSERKVYVMSGTRELARYGMMGGHDSVVDDPRNPTVDYGPSPAGRYKVERVSPHVSTAWAWSYVPYGAPLREAGDEVEYRDVDGTWHLATGPSGVFAGRNPPPLDAACYRDTAGRLYAVWQLNDFGHLRGQLRSLTSGQIQSHMIHSSPHEETTAAYFRDTSALVDPATAGSVLQFSHGCEHIHPKDLDEMVARGYLAPGTTFVVHGYDEVRTA